MRAVRNLSRVNLVAYSKCLNSDPTLMIFNNCNHILSTLNHHKSVRYSSSTESMKCSRCGRLTSNCSLFCSSSTCLKIQKIDPQKCSLYELFNLGPINYDIDLDLVDTNYRNLQKLMHPDKFSISRLTNSNSHNNPDDTDDRAISLENSAFINHANHVLKSPLERAFYILSIKGIDYGQEGKTIKNQDFMVCVLCIYFSNLYHSFIINYF